MMLNSSSLLILSLGWKSVSVATAQTVLDAGLVTRKTVDEYADISLDIREIRNYRIDAKRIKTIWDEGMHYVSSDGHRVSLSNIADELVGDDSPMAVISQQGLETAFTLQRPQFIAETVQNIISSNPDQAADAILASVLWMYASRLLFQGIQTCHLRTTADNPNYIQQSTFGLDEFIALWMGRDLSSNNSMYGLTQQVSELFGLNRPEAKANTAIKLLYQQGSAALALPNACTKQNPDTVSQLWTVAVQITNEMIKPLFQSLLHAIEQSDAPMARVYSSALIPHLHKCQPSLYKRFIDALVTGDIMQVDTDTLKAGLKGAAVNCFGIPCSDLSKNGYAITCNDADDESFQLAGYRAFSPTAAKLARIDLDIRMMEILFKRSPAATLVYEHGWHVDLPRKSDFDPFDLESLHKIALGAARSETAAVYLEYYDIVDYAEKMVIYPLLRGTSSWEDEAQQREALVLSASHQVVFLEALRRLDEVKSACEEGASDDDHHETVDIVAALLTGSLEGSSLGGSHDIQDGILAWNLGSRHAFRFQTLSSYNYGNVNQDLIDELYATKAEMDSGVCTRVAVSVSNIRGLMQTAMLQGIVAASSEIERVRTDETSIYLVQADTLATSILPLIHRQDAETAQFLKENLLHKTGVAMIQQGVPAVKEAITEYVQRKLLLSPCHYLGTASSLECQQYKHNVHLKRTSGNMGTSGGVGISVVILVWLL